MEKLEEIRREVGEARCDLADAEGVLEGAKSAKEKCVGERVGAEEALERVVSRRRRLEVRREELRLELREVEEELLGVCDEEVGCRDRLGEAVGSDEECGLLLREAEGRVSDGRVELEGVVCRLDGVREGWKREMRELLGYGDVDGGDGNADVGGECVGWSCRVRGLDEVGRGRFDELRGLCTEAMRVKVVSVGCGRRVGEVGGEKAEFVAGDAEAGGGVGVGVGVVSGSSMSDLAGQMESFSAFLLVQHGHAKWMGGLWWRVCGHGQLVSRVVHSFIFPSSRTRCVVVEPLLAWPPGVLGRSIFPAQFWLCSRRRPSSTSVARLPMHRVLCGSRRLFTIRCGWGRV